MRIGVMGGTFDPIHIGHLVAAEEARWALGLERVLFVPAHCPPHKGGRRVSPAAHRLRMVELAVATNPWFELSLVEVARAGPSYTVETVEILQAELGAAVELFFIIGMDSLADLLTWREPARLISLCRLVVVNRPPYPSPNLLTLESHLPGIADRVELVQMPGIEVAASDLRARVGAGLPIRYLVLDPVERYIREVGLYRGEPSAVC